jgi:hypothetical protein
MYKYIADFVETILKDYTQSANKHLLKVWIFLGSFVASASENECQQVIQKYFY